MATKTAVVPEDFLADMGDVNVQPLWDRYHDLLPEEPVAPDRPMVWHWETLGPLVDRASRDVDMKDAERRVLMLVNPDFGGKTVTTTNLFAGIQILEDGERARAHRHTPSAMRFIMEGGGGATIVNGQDCPMYPGDLILTPNWAWHEHYNDSGKRIVWLDALDVPLAHGLGTVFAQHGNPNDFPSDLTTFPDNAFAAAGLVPETDAERTPYSPMMRYPWERTRETLDLTPESPDGSRRLRYINPVDGGPVIATLDSYAWRLDAKRATAETRTTANAVFCVAEGEGVSTIGDQTIEWKKHDVFTVPQWNWTKHEARSENAYLFTFTDREVMRRLHFLRDEVRN